jgi:hypothetical protein
VIPFVAGFLVAAALYFAHIATRLAFRRGELAAFPPAPVVDPARLRDRKLEVELLVRNALGELAGRASMCWHPAPDRQVFNAEQAAAAVDDASAAVAELVAPRLAALDAEIEELARARFDLERDLVVARQDLSDYRGALQLARRAAGLPPCDREPSLVQWVRDTAARADHLAWVSAMTLGIAEGAQGWGLVREYPAGTPKGEGMPALVAVKRLRRCLQASLGRESCLRASLDDAQRELDELRANLSPPDAPSCPLEPEAGPIVGCLDALNPGRSQEKPACAEAARCHQVLERLVPELVKLHGATDRVAAPA